jgi:hypothetical protein
MYSMHQLHHSSAPLSFRSDTFSVTTTYSVLTRFTWPGLKLIFGTQLNATIKTLIVQSRSGKGSLHQTSPLSCASAFVQIIAYINV